MSEEEKYKKQVWILENEKKVLIQQVERLEGRLQEYLTWSEQVQKILEENKNKISQLEQENKNLFQKVNQGTVAMSNNLLDENSIMNRKLQDIEGQFRDLAELINPLVQSNVLEMDTNLRKKVVNVFSKSDNDKKIIALFVQNPKDPLNLTKIASSIGLSQADCSVILKRLGSEDFVREISSGVYQTVASIGDRVVSTRDLSRVSTEALHDYIIEQINSTIDSARHASYLDDYSNELQKRGEINLSQNIMAIKGDLYMAKRSADWIVDRIEQAIEKEATIPPTSRQTSTTSRMTSSRSFTSSYTTPEVSSRMQFQNPGLQTSTQLVSIDTKEWTKLSNADVIDNLKLQISDRMDYMAVIEGLNALRDHLSSSVSGRALYQINNLINQIKNKKSFDKNEVHNTLVDLMTKV